MQVSKVQKILAGMAAMFGLGILVSILFVVRWAAGTLTDKSIFVAGIVATLASPVGFALLTAAWRLVRSPSEEMIRRQARAARALEQSLDDWQYAESQRQDAEATKAAIDSYIELRTRKQDLERRQQAWDENAQRLADEHEELVALAAGLDEDEATRISPAARATLDRVLQSRPSPLQVALEDLGFEFLSALPMGRIGVNLYRAVRSTRSP